MSSLQTYWAGGVSVVFCDLLAVAKDIAEKVALQDSALGSNGSSSLGGRERGAIAKSIDVVELVVAKSLLVNIDPSISVREGRGLDEIGGTHGRCDMQKVVRESEGRALGVTSEDVEDGLLRVGTDLGEVGEIVDVQVAGLADLEQLVGVLVDCKDLAESCEVVDLCLVANTGLAPLLLSEVHDLLRGSCALDGGRGHGEESVAALEGLDKLVCHLDRLCRVVGRNAVLSQCLGQVLDLAPVDLDLLAIDK